MKDSIIKEIQELQKIGATKNLGIIEHIQNGDYDETIENTTPNLGVSATAGLILQLDEVRT